ncbi:MAG: hypothetical protein FD146_1503 [Anaerolineaceae bacterium]|nr:MAG: hypothetical protein FD146_1503 [Anaerolineaceae bacterium]
MTFLRRIPWLLVGGVALGVALGLVYTWIVSPVTYVDAAPDALRSDFKDQYRVLIASAYQADGDLDRARARLASLRDPDPAAALTGQASALLAAGDPDGSAYALLQLAQAVQPPAPTAAASSTPTIIVVPATMPPTDTPFITDTPGGPPTDTPSVSETPFTPTVTPFLSATPRPSRTPTPTPGLPYALAAQETVCNANLLDALIQVQVRDAAGYPVPGVDILVTWDGGREHIFTGLKPELGNGYADFAMTPGIVYSVQVASGGAPVEGLEAPTCEAGGVTWWGSLRLVFQQP